MNKKIICTKLEKKYFVLFYNNQNLRFRIQNYAMTRLKPSIIRQRMETRHFIFIGEMERVRVISKVNNISILTFSVDVKKRYIKKKSHTQISFNKSIYYKDVAIIYKKRL